MQMNFVVTPEFEMDIFDLMMQARIRTRSEAVRYAVHMVADVMRERGTRENAPSAGNGASR
jgi:Arc/MetJ-type ribon-helix-helix transcriptional regulator